ncbi:MAG: ABC transporter ATP-binding protein [Angustibacter sp.]
MTLRHDHPAGHEATPASAVRIRGLTKQFGTHVAVRGLDLDVPAGSTFGLVGPNGAGKTTTLSMLTGLLRPDAGTVEVTGLDVWRDPVQVKRRIGVVPDGLRLFDRLTGPELLQYVGRLRRMDPVVVAERMAQLLAVLDLAAEPRKLVIDYSTGMRKKMTLATALLHDPRVLVLDEPFESVDPVSAHTIRTVLQRYVERGGTVLLSSHDMALVERACDHVAVITDGVVRVAGTLAEVRGGRSLEEVFLALAGAGEEGRDLRWLGSSSG